MESPQERQENEIQALKAIFAHELRDVREEDAWNVWRPLEIVITLTPQQGSSGMQEVHAHIDLHVTCTDQYPEQVPTLKLEKGKGLSSQDVVMLQSELEVLADELKGEVMIFELAQHVQKFLHQHNKPRFKSFYEEMLSRQEQQQQQQQLIKKQKEDKQRQAIQDEIQRKQEALKEEQRRRRNLSRSVAEENDTEIKHAQHLNHVERNFVRSISNSRKRSESASESSDNSHCTHRGTQLIHFTHRSDRQIYRGLCLGHSTRGSVSYHGMDMVTGEVVAIIEWSFKCKAEKKKVTFSDDSSESSQVTDLMKQIQSIEQELNYLQKLQHDNLLRYLCMMHVEEKENLVVYIVQEYVVGINLSVYLTENLALEVDFLRHHAIGILKALSFLHQNNVVHKDLRDTSVFIDKSVIGRTKSPAYVPSGTKCHQRIRGYDVVQLEAVRHK